jgi:hypothetical protein
VESLQTGEEIKNRQEIVISVLYNHWLISVEVKEQTNQNIWDKQNISTDETAF